MSALNLNWAKPRKLNVYFVVKELLNALSLPTDCLTLPPRLFKAKSNYTHPHCRQQVANYLECCSIVTRYKRLSPTLKCEFFVKFEEFKNLTRSFQKLILCREK